MYLKKDNVWKLLIVLSGILFIIVVLIIGRNDKVVRKCSTTLEEKIGNPELADV